LYQKAQAFVTFPIFPKAVIVNERSKLEEAAGLQKAFKPTIMERKDACQPFNLSTDRCRPRAARVARTYI